MTDIFETLYKKYELIIEQLNAHHEKDPDDDYDGDWDEDLWEIQAQLRWITEDFGLKPQCCDNEGLNWFAGDKYDGIAPGWYLSLKGKNPKNILFCPFCATKLPEVVLKKPSPQYVHVPDGEDHCGTCKERNRNCYCFPPEAAYEIKEVECPVG